MQSLLWLSMYDGTSFASSVHPCNTRLSVWLFAVKIPTLMCISTFMVILIVGTSGPNKIISSWAYVSDHLIYLPHLVASIFHPLSVIHANERFNQNHSHCQLLVRHVSDLDGVSIEGEWWLRWRDQSQVGKCGCSHDPSHFFMTATWWLIWVRKEKIPNLSLFWSLSQHLLPVLRHDNGGVSVAATHHAKGTIGCTMLPNHENIHHLIIRY